MFPQIYPWVGMIGLVPAIAASLFSHAHAHIHQSQPQLQPVMAENTSRWVAQTTQTTQPEFQGRGVVQGSAFTRGRNANVTLTITRNNNFIFSLVEPPGSRARVQYRGTIARQNNTSTNAGNFTLDGRVQTFDSSANQRILNNTTGTCRIEVFDARVISSTCRSVAPDSTTEFLGLEQF